METYTMILGSGGAFVIDTGVPILGGDGTEWLLPEGQPAGQIGAFTLFKSDEWFVGAATVEVMGDPEAVGLRVYSDLLVVAQGWNLARIWNYVPAINDLGPSGLENYRAFSRGRSLAFEARFGAEFERQVPAASAVGTSNGRLTVVFAATKAAVRFAENPLQMPAYHYPADYGPRAPSFARATVASGVGGATVFISGTAAIRGHLSVAPSDMDGQLACTLENLREISIATDLSPALGSEDDRVGSGPSRFFKVYIRYDADFAAVAQVLKRRLIRQGDVACYLRSDICRANLAVEIEVTSAAATLLATIPKS